MAQTKEQQNPRKRTKQLSDADFKTLGIQVLQRLIGYCNSKEKTQVEMKVTLSEIKKNLQGTNSGGDEAEIQTNDLGHEEGKSIQSEQEEKNLNTNSPGHRWPPQGLRAESSPPPGFIPSSTLFLPGGGAELSLNC